MKENGMVNHPDKREGPVVDRRQWKMLLQDDTRGKADLLVSLSGMSSREAWFAGVVTDLAAKQIARFDLVIAALNDAAGSASDKALERERAGDSEGAAEARRVAVSYREEYSKYEVDRRILRGGARP